MAPYAKHGPFINKSDPSVPDEQKPKITAGFLNAVEDLIAALEQLSGDSFKRSEHTGTQIAATISDFDAAVEANAKVSGIENGATADQTGPEITALIDTEGWRQYTDAEKTKLAGLESSKFLGTFVSLSALQTVHPAPVEGSYAYVDAGVGANPQQYIWDSSDAAYVQGAGGTADTASQVKTKYESNPDTNAYTDAEQTKLGGVEQGAAADMTAAEILQLLNTADPGAFDADLLVNAPGTTLPTKLGYLTFGGTKDSERTDLTNFHVRSVLRLPVGVNRFRIKLRNHKMRNGSSIAGAIQITGAWIGEQAPTANGDRTGNFKAAPVQIFGAGEMPTNATEFVSVWVDASTFEIEPHKDYVLSIGYTCAPGQRISQASNEVYVGSTAGNANAITNPIAGFSNQCFAMLMEYEFLGSQPVVMGIGDSITEGTGSRLGQRHNWLTQYGLSAGTPPIVCGIGGSQAQEWVTPGYKFDRFDSANPLWGLDAVFISLGRNDLSADRSTGAITGDLQAIINYVRANLRPKRIYLCTIVPTITAGWSTTQEARRLLVNSWMRTLPSGIVSVIDFERAVWDDHKHPGALPGPYRGEYSTTTGYVDGDIVFFAFAYFRASGSGTGFSPLTVPGKWQRVYGIHADYDGGDGIHPNEAGYAKMASILPPIGA